MKKRILILERNHQGHRLTGVRVLLDALLDLKSTHDVIYSITLATTQVGFSSTEFQEQLGDASDHFEKLILKGRIGAETTLNAAWAKVSDWRQHVCQGEFDHVYIPYGDGLVQMLAALRFIPGYVTPPANVCVETILMRGSFGYENARSRTRKVALFGIRYAPIERLHLIDPLPYEYLQIKSPSLLRKVNLLPDPITATQVLDKGQARRALLLSEGNNWIGCIGMIDHRKGADKLVNAFVSAELPSNVRLLLAGKHSSDLLHLISQKNDPRIVSIDRYLTELELNQALGALDLVATPYPDFIGSASIVLRAAAGERFCLGANSGWMKRVIPAFHLGVLCDVNNQKTFSTALAAALPKALQYKPTTHSREFVQYGSLTNVYAHWTDLLRQRSGIEPHEQRLAWPKQLPVENTVA